MFHALASISSNTAYRAFVFLQFGGSLAASVVLGRWLGLGIPLGSYEGMAMIGALCMLPLVQGAGATYLAIHGQQASRATHRLGLLAFVLCGAAAAAGLCAYELARGLRAPDLWIPFAALTGLQTAASYTEHLLLARQQARPLLAYGLAALLAPPLLWGLCWYMGYGLAAGLWLQAAWAALRLGLGTLYIYGAGEKEEQGAMGGNQPVHTPARHSWPQQWLLPVLHLAGSVALGHGMLAIIGILVELYGSGPQLALYRYGSREIPLLMLLTSAAGRALTPVVAGAATAGNLPQALAAVRAQARQIVLLGTAASLPLVLLGPWLYGLVYGPAFSTAGLLFSVFQLLAATRMVLIWPVLNGLRMHRAQLAAAVVEAATGLALGLVLVPVYGAFGAIAALIAALSIEKTVQVVWLYRQYGVGMGLYMPVRLWLAASLAMAAAVAGAVLLYC